MSIRLAIVADIHHGKDSLTKLGSTALPLMADFARFVADARPDAVIDLGDRISDVSREQDLILEREVAEAFAPIAQPRFHLCGNHDRDHLDVADNEAILGQSLGHQTLDLGDWTIVLWRADSRIRRSHGSIAFHLAEEDLLWLAGVVAQARKPIAIMSHVPVSGHSQIGNYYFERNPEVSVYPGAERVRAALRMAQVPVVWISGHVHWNTCTIVDGIPHITLQSLTESFTTNPAPAGSMGLLELSDRILWQVSGADSFRLDLAASETARRWVPPLGRFVDRFDMIDRLQKPDLAAE